MNEILMIFLEKICEAIYFSLFIVFGKKLKEKRILFTIIMIFEYLMLTNIFHYSLWIHILYFTMTYINLKVLYKEKAQITDVFLMAFASILLIIISILCGLPQILFKFKYFYLLIINRILMLSILYTFKNKIYNIYISFCNNWNKKRENKIKSLTLRNISIILFNFMFYVLNLMLLYAVFSIK